MTGGAKMPPLPPLAPPTVPAQEKSPLNAELAAQGRRSGLRAALLSKVGGGRATTKSNKLGGTQ